MMNLNVKTIVLEAIGDSVPKKVLDYKSEDVQNLLTLLCRLGYYPHIRFVEVEMVEKEERWGR